MAKNIDAHSRTIENYKNLLLQCLALLYCVVDDEIPKHAARDITCKLEKRFHEITWAYEEVIKPDMDRIMGRELRQTMKGHGLKLPGDR